MRLTMDDVFSAVTFTRQLKAHAARGDILSVPMPNGKTLAESTFEEVGEMGERMKAVGEWLRVVEGNA